MPPAGIARSFLAPRLLRAARDIRLLASDFPRQGRENYSSSHQHNFKRFLHAWNLFLIYIFPVCWALLLAFSPGAFGSPPTAFPPQAFALGD